MRLPFCFRTEFFFVILRRHRPELCSECLADLGAQRIFFFFQQPDHPFSHSNQMFALRLRIVLRIHFGLFSPTCVFFYLILVCLYASVRFSWEHTHLVSAHDFQFSNSCKVGDLCLHKCINYTAARNAFISIFFRKIFLYYTVIMPRTPSLIKILIDA